MSQYNFSLGAPPWNTNLPERKVNINDNLIFIVIKLMSALVFIVGSALRDKGRLLTEFIAFHRNQICFFKFSVLLFVYYR